MTDISVSTLIEMCGEQGFDIVRVPVPQGNGYQFKVRARAHGVEDSAGAQYDDEESAARACLNHVWNKLDIGAQLALAFESSFQKPEIYRGQYFSIETDHGTETVPAYVIGRTCETHVEAFLNYLEGTPLDEEMGIPIQDGWIARVSAPGYMDCSAWEAHSTYEGAARSLIQNYGN